MSLFEIDRNTSREKLVVVVVIDDNTWSFVFVLVVLKCCLIYSVPTIDAEHWQSEIE